MHPALLGTDTYAELVRSFRPTRYIRCNEASGSVLKDYGSAPGDGAIVGTPRKMGAPGVPGIDGAGLQLVRADGSYATAGNAAPPSSAYTIMCWAKSGDISVNAGIWGQWASNVGLMLFTDPFVVALIHRASVLQFAASSNAWYHLMGMWSGSNLWLYVNGVRRIGPTANGTAPGTVAQGWTVGSYDFGGSFTAKILTGTVQECAVWDRNLGPGAAAMLYAGAFS